MFDNLQSKLKKIEILSANYQRSNEELDEKIIQLERMFVNLKIPFSQNYKVNEQDSLVWDDEKKGLYMWRQLTGKAEYTKLTLCGFELKNKSLQYISPLLDDIIKRFDTELAKSERNKPFDGVIIMNDPQLSNFASDSRTSESILEPKKTRAARKKKNIESKGE